MVYQSEHAPLSRILPQLYLGAESDVTQDGLSARGISYVLSVSRCCPQPSFLPQSQYLRIPIDDSLRDDLLPWIPQALRFIDGAMSLGCSVIVHCAAGISRSPALAVAYVMYSLRMDLDQAYRFVKERRPTISPNFNFLGQLQLFQGTLPLKGNANQATQQPATDTSTDKLSKQSDKSAVGLITRDETQVMDGNTIIKGDSLCQNKNIQPESCTTKPEFASSLSDKLRTLTLSVEPVQRPATMNLQAPKLKKPTHLQLQLPSVSEKRRSLTLSLTPLSPVTPMAPTHHKGASVTNLCQNTSSGLPVNQQGEMEGFENSGASPVSVAAQKQASVRCSKSRSQKRRNEGSACSSAAPHWAKEDQSRPKRERAGRMTQCVSTAHQQEASGCAVEAAEAIDGDQSPVSPINVTINRLLGWGERMLLGVLLGPHIKVGQAALPYKC